MIPIVYLILIIPLEYALELYAKYELLFLRMTFKEEKDKKIRIRHRIAVFCACRFSVRRVLLFQREYMRQMYVRMKDDEFKELMMEFKEACKKSYGSKSIINGKCQCIYNINIDTRAYRCYCY